MSGRSNWGSQLRRRVALFAYLVGFWTVFAFASTLTLLSRALQAHRLFRVLRGHRALRVLFAESQPPTQAGHHYRVTKWIEVLEGEGFRCHRTPTLPEHDVRFQLGNGTERPTSLAGTHMRSLLSAFLVCLRAAVVDVVVVRRELHLFNDNGGAFLDRLLVSINPNAILDFDDNISAMKDEGRRRSFFGALLLDQPAKFRHMLGTYRYFTPAHASMMPFIQQIQPGIERSRVLVLPMCVDYHHSGRKRYGDCAAPLTLGWLGSGANLGNLDILLAALIRLSARHPLRLVVVSNAPYVREAPFPIVNESWSLATELRLLASFDIGLSPLPPPAQRRIGTFKLVQYMGYGLVSVASSLPYTRELIRHGENGFLVECDSDWEHTLNEVFDRRPEYDAIGQEAQHTIVQGHSYESLRPAYVQFLRQVAEG